MHDGSAAASETGSHAVDEAYYLNTGLIVALLWCAIVWEVVVLGVMTLL